jgi:DNA (cytosine-5)-methyltransferase 1
MRYASVCDGIGAAHVAWQPLGWDCRWTAEIDAFPSAVVEQRWGFENRGDMTNFKEWNDGTSIDVLVGGTPCQSFSVAGLRKGLRDPRGGLVLTFLEIAQQYRPRWIVWENVPGVLLSNGGRDFGSFLGAMAELGYGVAYRVLDARHFGLPQRRRRVFAVACLGNWAAARSVLFDDEGGGGDFAAAQLQEQEDSERGEGDSTLIGGGVWWDGGELSQTLDAVLYKKQCLPEKNRFPAVLVPAWVQCECCDDYICQVHGVHAFECECAAVEEWVDHGITPYEPCLLRYITPLEAERLQGLPDDYTAITFRNKPAADGPRYKAIGNSMAVPVMRWIGERIALADSMERERQ